MKRKTIGTGMTQYTVEYSETEDKDTQEQILDIVEASKFENLFDNIFHWCMEKLPDDSDHIDTTQVEDGDDSETGYALRILGSLCTAKDFYDKGFYDFTIASMFSIGLLIKESNMKFEWEPVTMEGLKSITGSAQENERRQKEAAARDKLIAEMAAEIRKSHPKWKKTDIANQISKKLKEQGFTEGTSLNTIRQKI